MSFDHIYANKLLDYYSGLLTSRQRQVAEDYYRNDFSMQEIAINEKISKAAVSDLLNRVRAQLLYYEEILHLVEKNAQRYSLFEKIQKGEVTDLTEISRLLQRIEVEENE